MFSTVTNKRGKRNLFHGGGGSLHLTCQFIFYILYLCVKLSYNAAKTSIISRLKLVAKDLNVG
jgi:hypothetical protein